MVFVQICVGSSCHLKGAPEIVSMLEAAVASHGLEDDIVLSGSFCTGRCNRVGVTITVNDEVHTGITPATFDTFFRDVVMPAVARERS